MECKRLVLILFLGFGLWNSPLGARSISFDSPFRACAYKKVLDMCMRIWGDLSIIEPTAKHHIDYYQDIIETVLGRVTYCAYCLDALLQEKSIRVSQDEFAYLAHLISRQMLPIVNKIANVDDKGHIICMQQILDTMADKLNLIIEVAD